MADCLIARAGWRFPIMAALFVANVAVAQANLPDPTRPPVGMTTPVAESADAGGAVLQSVMLPKKGKPIAVISGQPVRLGERLGERRLIRLSEKEAVLSGPDGEERLLLTPQAEKLSIIPRTPAARRAQAGGQP